MSPSGRNTTPAGLSGSARVRSRYGMSLHDCFAFATGFALGMPAAAGASATDVTATTPVSTRDFDSLLTEPPPELDVTSEGAGERRPQRHRDGGLRGYSVALERALLQPEVGLRLDLDEV